MAVPVIDNKMLRKIMLGLPRFLDQDWLSFMRIQDSDLHPYEILYDPDAAPLLDAVLQPSPETVSAAIEEDLRPFYISLFENPEYTNGVWLSMNRIVSCRDGQG
jgi:hypothetical protein